MGQTDREREELTKLRAQEIPEKYFRDGRPDYDRALHAAAIAIHAGRVLSPAELAAVSGKANERVNKDMTLFFYAAYMRNLEAMGQLLTIGADPMLPMRPGGYSPSPFVEDVAEGSKPLATAMLKVLLDHGTDPNLRFEPEGVPLAVIVAKSGNLASFKLLLDRGADPWARQKEERPIFYSAMTMAAACLHYEMIAYAIDRGKFRDVAPEHIADLMKSIDIVWLRDDSISRATVAITRKIMAATGYAGDEHSRYILDFGEKHFAGQTLKLTYEIEDDGWPPFDRKLNEVKYKIVDRTELTSDDIANVKSKISQWVDPGRTLLTTAVNYNCDLRTVDMLLAAGADPLKEKNQSFAELAAINAMGGTCPEGALLDLYLKHGGDPNGRVQRWGSPLVTMAAGYEIYDNIFKLVDAGADPWARARGRFQRSAMETLAFQAGYGEIPANLQVIGLLADRGVFRNAPPKPLAGFMRELENKCAYFEKSGDLFVTILNRIAADTGYRSPNACMERVIGSKK